MAVEAGDVVLIRSDPGDMPRIVELSRAMGIVLAPAAGAVLMSLSTVIVAINAQMLRRVSL